MLVDNLSGQIRTQRGRLPLETINIHTLVEYGKTKKILSSCVNFSPKMVFVESYLLLDHA